MRNMNDDQVFEQLIQSSQELSQRALGMLAYGLYAADKRKRTKSNQESRLSQEDLETLFYETLTEDDLDEYREKAQQLIDKYLTFYIESLDLTALGLDRIGRDIQEINKKIITQFWLPVWQSIVASFIFTLILFFAALTVRFSAPNSSIGKLVQYLTAPDEYRLEVIKIEQDETITNNNKS